jgi:hypothetical protein
MTHARWDYDCPRQAIGHPRLAQKPAKPEGAAKSIRRARLPVPLYPELRCYCVTTHSPSEKR